MRSPASRQKALRHIVIIGHSLGANAAIAYAARHNSVAAAVVALAPGHLPETAEMRGRTQEAVAQAKQMVVAGQESPAPLAGPCPGRADFRAGDAGDLCEHVRSERAGRDPQERGGAAVGAASVGGRQFRPIFARGREYAFARAAKNPMSRYVEVSAGHLLTPRVAQSQVVEWLKSFSNCAASIAGRYAPRQNGPR